MKSSDLLFRSIYEHYFPILKQRAKRYGITEDDADDIVQETFLAYYKHYPLDWEDHQIRGALCKILKNLSIDYYRKKSKHPTVFYDPQQVHENAKIPDQLICHDSLQILLEREEYQEVWEALKGMRKDWAQVFFLHIIQGRSMEEVSHLLGTTGAACRTRLTRGRKYLKKKLKMD